MGFKQEVSVVTLVTTRVKKKKKTTESINKISLYLLFT